MTTTTKILLGLKRWFKVNFIWTRIGYVRVTFALSKIIDEINGHSTSVQNNVFLRVWVGKWYFNHTFDECIFDITWVWQVEWRGDSLATQLNVALDQLINNVFRFYTKQLGRKFQFWDFFHFSHILCHTFVTYSGIKMGITILLKWFKNYFMICQKVFQIKMVSFDDTLSKKPCLYL